MKAPRFSARPNPARDYAGALARFDTLRARDTNAVNAICQTQLLDHGRRVERAIVFWHGLSNCPRQFRDLGERFHALGYNVLIPRLPHHGLADRMTPELKLLTADKFIRAADEAVDIARGLGEHVTVAGLSAGGILAGWAAQERPDVDAAILINPAFAPRGMPMSQVRLLAPVVSNLPNRFLWWDPKERDSNPSTHAYPRFSTRGLAQLFRVSSHVFHRAAAQKPHARRIVIAVTDTDPSLENSIAETVAKRWRQSGAEVTVYHFDDLPVIHDIIDPTSRSARIDTVYPRLIELIDQPVAQGI